MPVVPSMLLFYGWYLKAALQEGDAFWILVSLLTWELALPRVCLFIGQRALWLWLLSLPGSETTEPEWTRERPGFSGYSRRVTRQRFVLGTPRPPYDTQTCALAEIEL